MNDTIITEPEFKQNTMIKSVKKLTLELPDETMMTVKDQKHDYSLLEKELGLSMEEPKKRRRRTRRTRKRRSRRNRKLV